MQDWGKVPSPDFSHLQIEIFGLGSQPKLPELSLPGFSFAIAIAPLVSLPALITMYYMSLFALSWTSAPLASKFVRAETLSLFITVSPAPHTVPDTVNIH